MTYRGERIMFGPKSWYVRFVGLLVALLFPVFVVIVKHEFDGTWWQAVTGTAETIVEMLITGNPG